MYAWSMYYTYTPRFQNNSQILCTQYSGGIGLAQWGNSGVHDTVIYAYTNLVWITGPANLWSCLQYYVDRGSGIMYLFAPSSQEKVESACIDVLH